MAAAINTALEDATEKASTEHTRRESVMAGIKHNLMMDAGFDEVFAAQLAAEAIDGMDMAAKAEEELIKEATSKVIGKHKRRISQYTELVSELETLGFDAETAKRSARRQMKQEVGSGPSLKKQFIEDMTKDDRVQTAMKEHTRRRSQIDGVAGVLGEFFDERESHNMSKQIVDTLLKAPMAPTIDEIIDQATEKALTSHRRKVSVLRGIKFNLMADAGMDETEAVKMARKAMIDLDTKKKDEEELIKEATENALTSHKRRVSQFTGLQSELIDLGFDEDKAKQVAKQQMKGVVGTGSQLKREITGELAADDAVLEAFHSHDTKKSRIEAMTAALVPFFGASEAHGMAKKAYDQILSGGATDTRGTGRRGSVEIVLDDGQELVDHIEVLRREITRLRDLVYDQNQRIEDLMKSKQDMARLLNDSMDEMRRCLLAYSARSSRSGAAGDSGSASVTDSG